jgi:hypothetical protein
LPESPKVPKIAESERPHFYESELRLFNLDFLAISAILAISLDSKSPHQIVQLSRL